MWAAKNNLSSTRTISPHKKNEKKIKEMINNYVEFTTSCFLLYIYIYIHICTHNYKIVIIFKTKLVIELGFQILKNQIQILIILVY